MTTDTAAAGRQGTWFAPAPGPIAVIIAPEAVTAAMYQLRDLVSRHGDSGWIHPSPSGGRDSLANMSQDLCDAIGAVGLAPPRTSGERHLLRALTHLIHGPVAHVVIDDVATLDLATLDQLHEVALISQTQLWLLIDASERPRRRTASVQRGDASNLLEWVRDVCTVRTWEQVLHDWARRPTAAGCPPAPARWWHEPLPRADAWTTRCPGSAAHPTPGEQVECLLSQARRALTAGHVTARHVRDRLTEYVAHRDTTADHRWALTAAGRDPLTPGADALGQTHPAAQSATLADVLPDGSAVRIETTWIGVADRHRPAIARLRTSRRLAGCASGDPIDGIFDNDRGAYSAMR